MATKSTRRRSREYALQGVYQWLLAGGKWQDIVAQIREDRHFEQADAEYFAGLLAGVIGSIESLDALLAPHLDRAITGLTPIERAILEIAAFELRDRPEAPWRVIVNEAIELAKTFGGTDGHKYVNAVLDRAAREFRAAEYGPAA